MASERPLTSDELDQVVGGTLPAGRDDLLTTVEVLRRLRACAAAEPVPVMRAELAELLSGTVIDLRDRPRKRRSTVAGLTLGVAMLVGTGVAAASDALPGPLQEFVSDGANVLGLDVPDGRGHAGTDPQPEHGNDVNGHQPQGPKADKQGATPADPGDQGNGATPATPPEQSNRPDDAGAPEDPGQPQGTGQPDDPGKPTR